MSADDWKLFTVVTEGDALDIDSLDVWFNKWNKLAVDKIEIPHPHYPNQRHKLWPYYIDAEGRCVVFMAGELSNGVWCFYTPVNGQPQTLTKGMTVNEKLFATNTGAWLEKAIQDGDVKRAQSILIMAGLNSKQAEDTTAAILADPAKYGF